MRRENRVWIVIDVLLMLTVAALVIGFLVQANDAKANPPKFQHNRTANSTSTAVYLKAESNVAAHATNTLSFLTNGAESVDLHLLVTPTSSESTLLFTVERSINNIDWYGEDFVIQNPALGNLGFLHSSSTPDHLWSPATTTDSDLVGRVIQIDTVESNYMRFNFSAQDGSNNLEFWADAITKIQQP